MLNNKLNAQGGGSPPLLWLPRCDTSRTGATSSSLCEGAAWGGQAHVPSFLRTSILNFISREKEF